MKKFLFALLALVVFCAVTPMVAGNNNEVREKRNVPRFERVMLKGSPTIKYKQGNQCSVEVKAAKNIIKNVITKVEGNKLVVNVKSSNWLFNIGTDDDVVVYVTSPDLIGVELQGSGNFESKGCLDTDNLDIEVKGSGDLVFNDIICDRIRASLVGSGDLDLEKVIALYSNVELVGSGDMKIRQQKVKQTKVELKGSGDIMLSMVDCGAVDCNLLGSGDITLLGDVLSYKHYSRGSGDIHTIGLNVRNARK